MGGALMARTFCIVFGVVLLLAVATAREAKHYGMMSDEYDGGFGFVPYFERAKLNLGVETVGGEMSILIPRETTIPVQKSKVFTTTKDQQTSLTIQVFEGVSTLTNKCLFLGEFNLTGIPPAPRGAPQIKTTFIVDSNYTLIVEAEDEAYGISEKITIPYYNYTVWDADVEQMVREDEDNEEKSIDNLDKLVDRLEKEVSKLKKEKNFEYFLELMDEMIAIKESRWRFKNKSSTSENQIAEKESIM